MKNFKKIASAIAALSLAACMVAPVAMTSFAATGGTNSVTISNSDGANHTYEAIQVFSGTLSDGVLVGIDWGDGVDGSSIIAALKADNDLKSYFSGVNSAAEVAKVLSEAKLEPAKTDKVFADDNALMQKFADIVGKNLLDGDADTGGLQTKTSGTVEGNQITGLPDGYYLIQDSAAPTQAVGGKNSGAKTRFILEVIGGTNVPVTTKNSAPEVMKKVKEESYVENNDNVSFGLKAKSGVDGYEANSSYAVGDGYNDVADYDIGDAVPFKLYGSMPETLGDYEHYYYKFTDTLGKEFVAPNEKDITIKIDGTEVTPDDENVKVDVTTNGDNTITITVEFIDILQCTPKPTATSVVTVEYSANLDSDAEIGLPGQENKVDLTYSNNPNSEWDGTSTPDEDTGKTPEDKVIVFTYEIDNTKVDAATDDELSGAKFSIFDSAKEGKIAKLKKNTDGTYTIIGWEVYSSQNTEVTDDTEGYVIASDTNGIFNIKGVDEGTYYLEEVAAPATYNKLTERVELKLEANTLDNEEDDKQAWSGEAKDALTSLKLTVDSGTPAESKDTSKGKVENKVENAKGAELPSTGGIGTTLFYLGGGALVAVAGVMLITKKRMTKE